MAAVAQYGAYFAVLVVAAVPLGHYIARVYDGQASLAQRLLGPLERGIYRITGIRLDEEMTAKRYAFCLLAFNLAGALVVYLLQRLQGYLPLNPAHRGGVDPFVAFNTAVSFASNTNWQAYGGETTMSPLTQMAGLTVQNFLSAATGMAVAAALARGFIRRGSGTLGSFWVDLTRGAIYVLLPLSLLFAGLLVSQGVVQTFEGSITVKLVEPQESAAGQTITEQVIPLGPVASQVAIKQLGTNGGGYFNANSAHPFENPTPLSNFLELLAILLIPAALCFTFGSMVKSRRHGWVLFATMVALVIPPLLLCAASEHGGNRALADLGIDQAAGNMEGKEVRFGAFTSALWATVTTAASNGSVNAMHDSFTPLGGLAPMWLMQLGEVAFGGVGSGLYGLLMFAIIAVFIAGLMVGRTPELLGKKLEAYEMKMAALVVLLPSAAVLVGTAIACALPAGRAQVLNPGPHGFSEMLYAFSSAANNNGSAFSGLDATNRFYTLALSLCMLIGRYWVIVFVLAVAGALGRKNAVPVSAGTLPTDTPLFALLLIGTVLLIGALTFIPALALGPVVEHLRLAAVAGGAP
ncbi:MAG: potassium-transporting ATPase subunit KdpA [Myxococcota bacterium]|jgi:K+-transporting ATPase ATPase A chain|nr:potassium-transporting ATPase subunit KdpA [Myxococcota bacterium]